MGRWNKHENKPKVKGGIKIRGKQQQKEEGSCCKGDAIVIDKHKTCKIKWYTFNIIYHGLGQQTTANTKKLHGDELRFWDFN
jgi:hypothetical protein